MLTLTLRGMLAHKVRLVLTTASIALGVAFLAGTFVLTDTMGLAFDQLFSKVSSGNRRRGPHPCAVHRLGRRRHQPASDRGIRPRRRRRRSRCPGRRRVGDRLRAPHRQRRQGNRHQRGCSDPRLQHARRQRAPRGRHPVVRHSAGRPARGGHRRGQRRGPPHRPRVDHPGPLHGARAVVHRRRHRRVRRREEPRRHHVGVLRHRDSAEGPRTAGLLRHHRRERRRRRQPTRPRGPARHGRPRPDRGRSPERAVAQENSDATNEDFKIVGVLFTVFAAIALFVGGFIIWNTFTMVVTQRSREIALLRAVGATRRQVLRSLMLEAVVLGSAASLLGIGLGVGVAKGLGILMDAMGFALPSTSLQLEPRTIVVALVVGTLTTVLAALVPARRATKVLPVEALRESTPGAGQAVEAPRRHRPGHRRRSVRPACWRRCTAEHRCPSSPSASSRCVAGVLISLPLAVGPLASLIGVPLRLRGLPGRARGAERPTQPSTHLLDRRRADDRTGTRGQHERLRIVTQGVVRRRARRTDGRRPVHQGLQRTRTGLQPQRRRGGPEGVRRRRRLTHRLGRGTVRR